MQFVRPKNMTDFEQEVLAQESCPKCHSCASAIVRPSSLAGRLAYDLQCYNCQHIWSVHVGSITHPEDVPEEGTEMKASDVIYENNLKELLSMSNNKIKQLNKAELLKFVNVFEPSGANGKLKKAELQEKLIKISDAKQAEKSTK